MALTPCAAAALQLPHDNAELDARDFAPGTFGTGACNLSVRNAFKLLVVWRLRTYPRATPTASLFEARVPG